MKPLKELDRVAIMMGYSYLSQRLGKEPNYDLSSRDMRAEIERLEAELTKWRG